LKISSTSADFQAGEVSAGAPASGTVCAIVVALCTDAREGLDDELGIGGREWGERVEGGAFSMSEADGDAACGDCRVRGGDLVVEAAVYDLSGLDLVERGVGFAEDANDIRVDRGLTGVGELSCTTTGLTRCGELEILGGVFLIGTLGYATLAGVVSGGKWCCSLPLSFSSSSSCPCRGAGDGTGSATTEDSAISTSGSTSGTGWGSSFFAFVDLVAFGFFALVAFARLPAAFRFPFAVPVDVVDMMDMDDISLASIESSSSGMSPLRPRLGASDTIDISWMFDWLDIRVDAFEDLDVFEARPFFAFGRLAGAVVPANWKNRQSGDRRWCSANGSSFGSQPSRDNLQYAQDT
jgi:hypothetical protein